MATAYLKAESALAYPPQLPPRAAIEAAVETLVAVLDAMDGEPDDEEVLAEDGFVDANEVIGYDGPGCPIADPDRGVDDDPEGADEGV